MSRPRLRLTVLLVVALTALGAIAAVAFAATSGHVGTRHAVTRHADTRTRACRATAHDRAHHRRPRSRCRTHLHKSSKPHAPAVSPAASGAPSTTTTDVSAPALGEVSPVQAPVETQPSETPKAPPPSIPRVQVTAVEYSYSLSRSTVPAGKVILELYNDGQDPHNLNVANEESSVLDSLPNTAPQSTEDEEVNLRPGSYTLFCSLPGHEMKGMKATLVVEEAG